MTEDISRVIVEINDKKAAEKIESLEKKADELRKKLQEAIDLKDQKAIDNISKKLKETGRQIDQVRTKADKVRAAMRSLDAATPKQLRETIRAITSELNSGKIARGSKEWDAYVAKLKVAKAELAKVQAEMSATTSKATKLRDIINSWGASIAAGMAAFAGVVMTGRKAVQAYADIDTAMANTRKFTGMTAEQVEDLNEEFRKLNTRTSREELNLLAQEAGRLGKSSKEDIMGYVKAAQILNVALSDLGEGATQDIAKLNNIFKIEEQYGIYDSMLKIGSVINVLSQNCTASKPYLVEFANRLAGVGSQAGMTLQQIIGLGAVLDANAQKVEASSTAISQVLTRMYKEPAKYAKVAGLEVKSFSELLKKDANEALLTLLAALDKAGNMDAIAPMLGEMGESGARVTNTLSVLAKKLDEVRWQQQNANKAFEEGTSVGKEYEIQNNTVQAKLDKARKGFQEMAIALGKELVPAMQHCITGTSALMRVMLTLIQFIKKHYKLIGILAVAIVSYTVASKAATIATIAQNTALKTQAFLAKGLNAAYMLVTSIMYLFTGNIRKATAAFKLFNLAIKSNPIGLLVSALTTAIAVIGMFISKSREEAQARAEAAAARREEIAEYKKGLKDISAATANYAKEEITTLKKLYKTATDNAAANTERYKAAKKLIDMYPEYFGKMTTEQIAVGQASEAYARLREEIIKVAKAKAAAEKIQQNEGEAIDLEMQLEDARTKDAQIAKQLEKLRNRQFNLRSAARGNTEKAKELKKVNEQIAALEKLEDDTVDSMYDTADKLTEIEKTNKRLQKYVDAAPSIKTKTEETQLDNYTGQERPLSEKELKKLEKERQKQLKEEARKAKAELLQAIAEITVLREQSLAENTAMYANGLKDYRQYVEDEHDIRLKAVRDEKKVYEDRNLTSTKEYAKLIKEETDLLYKSSQTKRKLSLQELEKEKQDRKNFLTEAYSNPKSAMYGNDKAYRQKMLEADIEYLQKKKALYAAGSDEYEKISLEIEQKLADDKLQKQKELAANYENWRQQYEDMSGSAREQKELDMLKSLYDAKLISEEKYQEAVNDIKNKNMLEDQERHRKTQSEYGDMVLNIRNSFKILFDDIKDGGKLSLDNLASATESAFAVMGAALQSYSSFVNAERDAELAKVEARYDKEIKAAGSNSKKKEKLEKQKEEETAKIKNKYAKRQRDAEIAMALANTAQAALSAYASAVSIGAAGLVLAPIAAAMATAFGMMQVATIKKQYDANQGYYSGGFTKKDPDNRREVGVVHANEFVANHEAVENAAISPVLRLIDYAQRNNRVAALTRADVSNALGQGSGVSARGALLSPVPVIVQTQQPAESSKAPEVLEKVGESIDRLNRSLENGIESFAVIDGENGLANRLNRFNRLKNNPKRGKK